MSKCSIIGGSRIPRIGWGANLVGEHQLPDGAMFCKICMSFAWKEMGHLGGAGCAPEAATVCIFCYR